MVCRSRSGKEQSTTIGKQPTYQKGQLTVWPPQEASVHILCELKTPSLGLK